MHHVRMRVALGGIEAFRRPFEFDAAGAEKMLVMRRPFGVSVHSLGR